MQSRHTAWVAISIEVFSNVILELLLIVWSLSILYPVGATQHCREIRETSSGLPARPGCLAAYKEAVYRLFGEYTRNCEIFMKTEYEEKTWPL